MSIVKHRKIWYLVSSTLILASLFAIFRFGFNLGVDFTGGSLIEIEYANSRPETTVIKNKISELNYGDISVQPVGDKNAIVRLKNISDTEHQELLKKLSDTGEFKELRFDSVGPVIGKELKQKSIIAIFLVALMIILYIAFVFRKVSKPVSSFYYGLMAVAALIHDVAIPTGFFVILGKYYGVEMDALFITAILTVLGFSVHDTIVVFDRIRENLKKGISKDFEETVDLSVKETITRSINTSVTVFLVLLALLFFGGETTRYFSLALIVGVFFGTYSSIFIASPLLVSLYKFQQKRK